MKKTTTKANRLYYNMSIDRNKIDCIYCIRTMSGLQDLFTNIREDDYTGVLVYWAMNIELCNICIFTMKIIKYGLIFKFKLDFSSSLKRNFFFKTTGHFSVIDLVLYFKADLFSWIWPWVKIKD